MSRERDRIQPLKRPKPQLGSLWFEYYVLITTIFLIELVCWVVIPEL